VRLFDTRKLSTPLTDVDVGGGAWRIKWHPSEVRKRDLLVASMHDGFKVVRFGPLSEDGDSFSGTSEIINRNDDHSSMAYGADWCFAGPNADKQTVIGGCSFYDHKMSLWNA
jgi:diphthamide biosynthesis protein 7